MDSRWLLTMQVAVVGAQKVGAVPHGTRVTAPIGERPLRGPAVARKGAARWARRRLAPASEITLVRVGPCPALEQPPREVFEGE